MRTAIFAIAFLTLLSGGAIAPYAQTLNVPARPTDALSGSAVVERIRDLSLEAREIVLMEQFRGGNLPDFMRTLIPVTITESAGGQTRTAIYYVTPDYLCVGSDEDYFLSPITPTLAQQLADLWGCNLPTRKMVNQIWAASSVKLTPATMTPDQTMTTVPVFAEHNAIVRQQRSAYLAQHPLGALVAGHQKDVVVTPQLASRPGRVAIYGWHYPNGQAIQPLYLGHYDTWVDYSQCIRLVQLGMTVDGEAATVPQVLADSTLASLLSDEGAFTGARYAVPPPPGAFPYRDLFPATGRQLPYWTDRFTTPQIVSFSPPSPSGDGSVLVVRDPSGGIDTTRLGNAEDTDYFVQCDLYCRYRPELASDGFERIGIFARDNGNGMFDGRSSSGILGNNYALTWDSHTGEVRCLKTVAGTPSSLATPMPRASSAWRTFRIEAVGSQLTFKVDGEIIASVTDSTFAKGEFGIGYHEYFTTNSNILGAYADNFLAAEPNGANSAWRVY